MKLYFLTTIIIVLALSASNFANATLITYSDEATFLPNVDIINSYNFDGNNSIVSHGTSHVIDDVTFSAGAVFSLNPGRGGAHHQTGWLSLERLNYGLSFSQGITALSFDFGDYYTNAMTLTLTTNTGEVFIASANANSWGFGGFTTDQAFTSATITTSGTTGPFWGFDNFSYGNVSDIPEPSTLAIFGLAMIGLASRKLKKQS